MRELIEEVRTGHKVGVCLLPTAMDGSKSPALKPWGHYKTARPTIDEMKAFKWQGQMGVGMVAGAVSGRRATFDFDALETYHAFVDLARQTGLGELVDRIIAGYCDATPNDGRRWIVGYPESVSWSDTTLARRPGRDGEPKVKTLIELPTYAILAPSGGRIHPSGRPYVRLSGGFDTIATVTAEEWTDLLALARSFDQMPKAEFGGSRREASGNRPGDDYNRRVTWATVLEPHGWRSVYQRGEVTTWRRPGKTEGVSATTNVHGSDLFYCFTSSTAFEPEATYSKFAAYTVLNLGGDFAAAAKALAAQGYGEVLLLTSAKALSKGSTHPENAAAHPKVGVWAESTFPFRTAVELAAVVPPNPTFVAAFYVVLGAILELVGKAKAAGKTTFLGELVKAVLHGTHFLGSPTLRTPVVWLTEERETTFNEVLRRARLLEEHDLHIQHYHQVAHAPFSAVVTAACEKCEAVGGKLLIVDTVSQFAGLTGDSENNAGDALAALQPLQQAASKGLAVIAVRHERKGGGPVGESGRGSSAFVGGVDIHVSVGRPDGHQRKTLRVLRALSRFTETPEELVVDLTSTGYVALGSESSVAVMDAKDVLLAGLPSAEDSALDLETLCRLQDPYLKRSTVQRALQELPQVRRIGKGKKGDPHRWFKTMDLSAQTQITKVGRKTEENHSEHF